LPRSRIQDIWPSYPTWAIISLLVTALIVRGRYLWTHHLWNDELSTMRLVNTPWAEAPRYLATIEPHPPASFLFMKGMDSLFINQLTIDQLKYAVLIWTVLIGLASIWAIRHLPWLSLPIIAGLAVVAVNPLFAYLGSEVRPYSMLIAVAFGLIVVSSRWIASGTLGELPDKRIRAALVALLTLAAWTHYAGVLLAASVVISLELVSVMRYRKLDRPLLRGALLSAALTTPIVLFLRSQMSIEVSTARTPLPELAGYLGWAFGGLGVALTLGVLIAWIVRLSKRTRQQETPRLDGNVEIMAVGWFSLSVVILFFIGVALVWWMTGIQLANLGVSIVPALFAVVGFASLLTPVSEATVRWVIITSVIVSFPIALVVTDTPSIFRPNRVSNVDVLLEASRSTGIDHSAGDRTMLISLDSPVSNQYFASRSGEYFPAAHVQPVNVAQFDTRLGAAIEAAIQDPEIDQIVLVTRYGFDYRVRPFLPDAVRVVKVHTYAWLMELPAQDAE